METGEQMADKAAKDTEKMRSDENAQEQAHGGGAKDLNKGKDNKAL